MSEAPSAGDATECLDHTRFRPELLSSSGSVWQGEGHRQEATAGIHEGVVYVISLPAGTREMVSVGYIASAFIEFPSEPLP